MMVLPNLWPAPWRPEHFEPVKFKSTVHESAVQLIDQLAARYNGVPALARAMGVHPSRLYNIRSGADKAGTDFLARLEAIRRQS